MKILMFSLDRSILDTNSASYKRVANKDTDIIVISRFRFPKYKKYDLITCQDPLITGTVGYIFSKFYKCSLEIQIHHDNRLSWLERWIISKADRVRVVSQRIKDKIQHKNIFVKPVAVEKLKKKTKVLLAIGSLVPVKNHKMLIEAIRGLDVLLLIAGEGELRKKLEKQAKGTNTIFLGHQKDLVPFYKMADVLVHTAMREGYCRVFKEAEQFKLPIITTDVGIANEIKCIIIKSKNELRAEIIKL